MVGQQLDCKHMGTEAVMLSGDDMTLSRPFCTRTKEHLMEFVDRKLTPNKIHGGGLHREHIKQKPLAQEMLESQINGDWERK